MKHILTMILLLAAGAGAKAQNLKESAVPAAVVKNFHDSFKDAKATSWEKEKGNYEVEFVRNKKEGSALFSADGFMLESREEIGLSELPQFAADYIAKNYPDYKLTELKRGIAPTGESSLLAEIKKGKEDLELLFDSNGTFLGVKD